MLRRRPSNGRLLIAGYFVVAGALVAVRSPTSWSSYVLLVMGMVSLAQCYVEYRRYQRGEPARRAPKARRWRGLAVALAFFALGVYEQVRHSNGFILFVLAAGLLAVSILSWWDSRQAQRHRASRATQPAA